MTLCSKWTTVSERRKATTTRSVMLIISPVMSHYVSIHVYVCVDVEFLCPCRVLSAMAT